MSDSDTTLPSNNFNESDADLVPKPPRKTVRRGARKRTPSAETTETPSDEGTVTGAAYEAMMAAGSQGEVDSKSQAQLESKDKENLGNRNYGRRSNGNSNQNRHPKSKKAKGRSRNRWQHKKITNREEGPSLDLGDLPDFEAFANFEALQAFVANLETVKGKAIDFTEIYNLPLPELREAADKQSTEVPNAPNREQLIDALITQAFEQNSVIEIVGVLDLLEDESGGLLVYERDNYRVVSQSAFVPQALIKHYSLQPGHIIKARLHPHRASETCSFVVSINEVMGRDPNTLSEIIPFKERVPYYPTERILMETGGDAKWDNLSMRVVDCLTPIGFGQRGLIVAPPRTGKTVLLQGMANAIKANCPKAHLIILLIDERPEEVTDFRRQVDAEIISSTFDEAADSHVHAAEMVIEKARRMVEVGEDVIILLDSITRLARAYNTMMPNSGKILSGGVEANALQKPKRFFGSARNIEDGGSLTILGTALVETGSKMDEVIFEEFKGTGNMELHLDRGLSDKRIFPALSMDKSGTRKEELLYHPEEMLKIYSLRRAMKGIPSTDAMEMLIQRIKKTKTNAEFLVSVAR
ncbi:MAG: Transcription termination factor Rho [Opitutia bacterium UBA7350]|nr:MAG: Transcription termination factor Rho [Opitutae bacterium UBA7350]